MSKMIRLSNGNDVSQETVDAAMEEYTLRHPEEYIFQVGDVIQGVYGKRIIVSIRGDVYSVGIDGNRRSDQKEFSECKYRKIGVLSDYIK